MDEKTKEKLLAARKYIEQIKNTTDIDKTLPEVYKMYKDYEDTLNAYDGEVYGGAENIEERLNELDIINKGYDPENPDKPLSTAQQEKERNATIMLIKDMDKETTKIANKYITLVGEIIAKHQELVANKQKQVQDSNPDSQTSSSTETNNSEPEMEKQDTPEQIKKIDELLEDSDLTPEQRTELEEMKSKIIDNQIQQRKLQEEAENLDNMLKKKTEVIELGKKYESTKKEVERLEEINKVSLTDHEINFRRAMMKDDGSGLIQRLFACIEKEPRYATSPTYLAAKKEIEEAFKNPFDIKRFAKKQEEYIATRERYRELIAKDPNNLAEISKISTKLKRLQESVVTEANKYVFNKKKLETLYEKNIHQLSLLGSHALSAERNAILNEIKIAYEPFHERFDSERRLKFYTQDLAKIEAQMAELGVKKAEPETISKTATQGTPVTPAPSVGTATNPTGTSPENDPETKNHSGLHFIGLPNDKYYDSVRDAYRYGDEIEIDKEEVIDGTTFITLKGSDVKIEKNLFATTADIEDEFKHAMKAHKTSTNQIKAGMKVTPCWPGHYNRAILKNGSRGNEADIEVKNMKLHDEIEVEKVFYKGLKKFVKLVGYENAFSADSFSLAPSTIKEIAEKKEAAKKAKEELKAKKQQTGPENEQQAQVSEQQTPEIEQQAQVSEQQAPEIEQQAQVSEQQTPENEQQSQVSEQQAPENEQQAQINEINEADPEFDLESIIQEVKSYSPSNASENEPVVEEQKQSVSDFLNEAENTAEEDAFFNAEDKAAFQARFDEAYEESHGKKPVIATEETTDKQTKKQARAKAMAGMAKSKRTPLKVRIASMWSLITSKAGKAIEGKAADIAQNIVDDAQTQGASEEELKEAKEMQAEAARQEGKEPAQVQVSKWKDTV